MKRICVLTFLLAASALPAFSQPQGYQQGFQRSAETVTDRLSLIQQRGPNASTWHLDNLNGRFRIFTQPNLRAAGSEVFTINEGGLIGIGTQTPGAALHLSADNLFVKDRAGQFILSGRSNSNLRLYMGIRTELNPPVAQISFVEEGIAWRNISIGSNNSNIGIGYLDPREKLEVNGNIRAFGALMGNSAIFDAGNEVDRDRNWDRDRDRGRNDRDRDRNRDWGYRANDVILGLGANHARVFRVDDQGSVFAAKGFYPGGVDYAESVEVTGERSKYQPGDVMAIDPDAADGFSTTRAAYSTLVAGVYSTQPGVLASTHPLEMEKFAGEVPLAMFGIVPCKVSAENGPIARGDLLVSAATPGYAMKGTDKKRMLGAIVGKALDPLPQGTGTIRILLTSR